MASGVAISCKLVSTCRVGITTLSGSTFRIQASVSVHVRGGGKYDEEDQHPNGTSSLTQLPAGENVMGPHPAQNGSEKGGPRLNPESDVTIQKIVA